MNGQVSGQQAGQATDPGSATRTTPAPLAADGEWHRVHPLTPAIRSWQILVVLVVYVGQDLGQSLLRGDGDKSTVGAITQLRGRALAGGSALAVLVLLAGVGLAYLSWRFTRYRVTHDALELQHGVISRRQRRAPLDRLQAVDIVQPLLARIFGLARLTLEVAGGGDSKIALAYLTETQAVRLRNHLLASAAGVRYETAEAPEAPEHLVFTMPMQRLFGSLLMSAATVWVVVAVVGLVTGAVVFRQPGFIAGVLPGVLAPFGVLWARFSTGFGFRIATSPDGVRLRHGLLEQRTQTVPPGRVQAVRLRQPLLWRPANWWRVEVNVAGYGGHNSGDRKGGESGLLLPAGTRDEAVAVLSFVLPDLGVGSHELPGAVADAGLTGTLADGGFTPSPPRARWVDLIGWRRNGYRVTETALLLREGVLHRRLVVVPHARTQSCGVRQGPLQRRLRVASFALHSTPGPITPVVQHLDTAVVARLLDEQVLRARRARAGAGPERWMEQHHPAAGGSPDVGSSHPLEQPPEAAE
jgi:putative membrane protein